MAAEGLGEWGLNTPSQQAWLESLRRAVIKNRNKEPEGKESLPKLNIDGSAAMGESAGGAILR